MNYEILINKDNILTRDYVPKNLVIINEPTGKKVDKNYINYLDKEVYRNFKLMQSDALKENYELFIDSSYRSYEYQEMVFNNSVKLNGLEHALKYCALPGTSEHQTGLAIDIIYRRNGKMIEEIDEYSNEIKWLHENCYKYGFILRYPKNKENITGYNYEPWHIRYVGYNLSKYLFFNNLTLEEYYNLKKK